MQMRSQCFYSAVLANSKLDYYCNKELRFYVWLNSVCYCEATRSRKRYHLKWTQVLRSVSLSSTQILVISVALAK